jgi:hypothetical protein
MAAMGRQLIVELDEDLPPSGRVIGADGSSTSFSGWTELAQALAPDADADPPASPSAPG